MSERILAELGRLANAGEAFEEILKVLKKVFSDLDRDLSAGLAQWDDEAKDAYRHTHRVLRSAEDDMAGRLDHLSNVLRTGHLNYGRSLTANVRMWQGS